MKPTDQSGDPESVSLHEVAEATIDEICDLAVSAEQEKFVARKGTSITKAHFSDKARFRAIYAGETPVGFVM